MAYKKTVILPQPIEQEAEQYLLDNGCNLIKCDECTFDEVAAKLPDAEAVVLRTGIKFTDELISKGKNLKTISRTGAGVDNVDLKSATEHGIIVSSSLGANTSSVAEHALAMIMSLTKNLKVLDNQVRNKGFRVRYTNPSNDMGGKVLGLLGFGRIGSTLADYCYKCFGCKIVAFDEYLPDEVKKNYESWVEFMDMESVLKQSDFVSIHVPLTDATRDLINYDSFKMMKNTSIIVNTSRGGIINEPDLVKALTEGEIAGAGLDVFDSEPIEDDNPLLQMENAILTPHTAALTKECVVRMAMQGVERVVAFFNGEAPEKVANPEVLK
ncbi:MAG: hydroxyacid dehydrogenase [Spirochaetales bacterium]|uniref:Hydroxyacid dehydrogenase n=1 Tax=Candidatus Thalassospirochaeta sargassi TaxID=3119039 RepID=A0AAJ1IE77_9SPIO|nr:hydroxyacid dehydrogenase [Spirochaetales bacterium]